MLPRAPPVGEGVTNGRSGNKGHRLPRSLSDLDGFDYHVRGTTVDGDLEALISNFLSLADTRFRLTGPIDNNDGIYSFETLRRMGQEAQGSLNLDWRG